MISFFRHVHKSLQSEVVFCQPAHRHKHLDQLGTLIDSFIVSVLKNGDGLKMQMCRLFNHDLNFNLLNYCATGPNLSVCLMIQNMSHSLNLEAAISDNFMKLRQIFAACYVLISLLPTKKKSGKKHNGLEFLMKNFCTKRNLFRPNK